MDNKIADKLQELSSLMSEKETVYIEVNSKCNKDGEITESFENNFKFKENISYYVSLIHLTATSFFPNLNEMNNKFYYSSKAVDKDNKIIIEEITLANGCYEISDYNKVIQQYAGDNIQIILNQASGHVMIKLADGWKVYFDKPNTWHKELGYEKITLSDKVNISKNMADITTIQKIYLNCNIIRGEYYKGKLSNILYSFANNHKYSSLITYAPNPKERLLLINKNFNKIIFKFYDEDGIAIDLLGEAVTIRIEIKQS